MTDSSSPAFQVKCPGCGQRLRVQTVDLGTQRRCPRCKADFQVPRQPPAARRGGAAGSDLAGDDGWQPPVELPVVCGHCGTRYYAPPSQLGAKLLCPDCHSPNTVKPRPQSGPPRYVPDEDDADELRLADEETHGSEMASQEFRVRCHVCGSVLYCLPSQVGKMTPCPDCGTAVTVIPAAVPPPRDGPQAVDPGIAMRPAHVAVAQQRQTAALMETAHEKARVNEQHQPTPPRRPFVEGVWWYPWQLQVFPRWGLSAALLCVALTLIVTAFSLRGFMSIGAVFLFAITGVLVGVSFAILATVWLTTVETTSMGYDRVEEWPGFDLFERLQRCVLIFCGVAFSVFPGALFSPLVADLRMRGLLMLCSCFFCFPFVFLSQMDNGTAVVPFSAFVWRSLREATGGWLKFGGNALLLVALLLLPPGLGYWWYPHLYWSYALVVLTVGTTVVYFRLLGRLAWVIDERMPEPRDEVEEEDEDDEDKLE